MTDQATAHEPRRVLITGASGLIGGAAADHLAARGIAVTALSLSGPFPAGADRVFIGDATSPTDVEAALGDVDAVVHLAAIPHPSLASAQRVFTTNVTATFAVLSAAAEAGVRRAVTASSINAFGVPMNHHRPMPAYFPIDEEVPVDIDDPYSLSKQVDELTIRMAWRRWGLTTVALRFPLVNHLENLRHAAGMFDLDPERAVREGWAYLDLRDASRAIHAALTAPLSGAHVVGLSADDTLLARPTAEALAEFAPGVPVREGLPGRAAAIDTTRARTLLGFAPQHSVHDDEVVARSTDRQATA